MDPPVKYIKIDGVRKLNPEYTAYEKRKATGGDVTNLPNASTALPIVRNMEDHAKLCENMHQDIPLAAATDSTIDMLQDPDLCKKMHTSSDKLLDDLGRIFAKYEIPMGLMNKLLGLSADDFDLLQFIVDDSGSMGSESDYSDGTSKKYTRWDEAHERLKSMIEVLAYIPTPSIEICFLNRSTIIKNNRTTDPAGFIAEMTREINNAFSQGPGGGTPYLEAIQKSFNMYSNKRIARYCFGDGVPNGGSSAIAEIKRIIVNRKNPQNNPVTLLSCTDTDADVEWMKDLEESASYCSEIDDFHDEYAEVSRDQGAAMPFNKGFHLICQLVAAINPEDLDAMDESVPFTKYALDNLLGVQSSPEDYKHYFDHFIKAQNNNTDNSPIGKFKKSFNWSSYYNDFIANNNRDKIPAVVDYRKKIAQY